LFPRCSRAPIAALWIAAAPALAHHGWATHYDGNAYVTITGVVTKFEFVNPHAFVYLDAVNEAGATEHRWCEMQSRTQLERRGVGAEQFRVGSTITIEGFRSRQDPLGCELATGRFHDGTVLTLRRRDGQSVYGAPLAEGDTSIVGTWYPEVFLAEAGSIEDSNTAMTAAGEAAHAAFDWLTQNPTMHCSPVSNIRAWSAPGLPTRIERRGREIHIRHEFMDASRIVYLDRSEHPGDAPRTDLGHSIGRFADGVLYVETAGFASGALWAGRLHSEMLATTEKLWVDAESGHLMLEWTASDPVYYTGEHRGIRKFVRTNLGIRPFECDTAIGHVPTDSH
jgi:hypothetical protein